MENEEHESIKRANAEFYKALESGSIEKMDDIWLHENWVKCVHPGWDALDGWEKVRESWDRIFQSGQKMRISASNIDVAIFGDFAWVACTENITIFADTSFDSTFAVATNLFVQRQGSWLMVHHHASPAPILLSDSSSDTIQ